MRQRNPQEAVLCSMSRIRFWPGIYVTDHKTVAWSISLCVSYWLFRTKRRALPSTEFLDAFQPWIYCLEPSKPPKTNDFKPWWSIVLGSTQIISISKVLCSVPGKTKWLLMTETPFPLLTKFNLGLSDSYIVTLPFYAKQWQVTVKNWLFLRYPYTVMQHVSVYYWFVIGLGLLLFLIVTDWHIRSKIIMGGQNTEQFNQQSNIAPFGTTTKSTPLYRT